MDIPTLLSSTVIAGAISAITLILTNNSKQKNKNITEERKQWRDNMRKFAPEFCQIISQKFMSKNDKKRLVWLRSWFEINLNPYDELDEDILSTINNIDNDKASINIFNKQIARLLKHDWDRVKLENRNPIKLYQAIIVFEIFIIILSRFLFTPLYDITIWSFIYCCLFFNFTCFLLLGYFYLIQVINCYPFVKFKILTKREFKQFFSKFLFNKPFRERIIKKEKE